MHAVVITKHGGPGVLEVQERPDPALGPGQVRIAVAATHSHLGADGLWLPKTWWSLPRLMLWPPGNSLTGT